MSIEEEIRAEKAAAPDPRDKIVGVRFSDNEKREIFDWSENEGFTMSEGIRKIVLNHIRGGR